MMKKTGSALRRMTLAVLWRRRGVSLLLLLLAALGVFSAALLQNLALRQERSMADMIENTPIRCVVTNAQGASSDRLGMNSAFVDMLMGYRHERGCYADEAAKNVRAKASRPLQSPADTTLCRILSLASDSVLDPVSGAKVTFFHGWSEDVFLGTERVCIVPENLLQAAGQDADGSPAVTIDYLGRQVTLKIVGTVSGQTGATIWCPFYVTMTDGLTENFFVDSCSFDIRDNARLEACKEELYKTFVVPMLTNQPDWKTYGVIINDAEFIASVHEFESNLKTLRLLLPILLALFAGVGFLATYLTTRSRRREFAVMRCIGRKKHSIFWQVFSEELLLALLGAALVVGLTLLREDAAVSLRVDFSELRVWPLLYLFVSGAIAVSAMILPGISGSTLLLIAGVYLPAMHALRQLLRLDFSGLPGILALGLGTAAGAALAVRAIRAALRRFRSQMVWLILGLMAGSLYAIVMGPAGLQTPQTPVSLQTFSLPGFLLGAAVLLLLELLRAHRPNPEKSSR